MCCYPYRLGMILAACSSTSLAIYLARSAIAYGRMSSPRGWINAVKLTNTYTYEKRSKAMDGSRPSERLLDGSNGANANAMLTVFLKSLGIVQITMHNYHQLLDVLAGDEKERVKRLIKKRFGITVP